MNGIFGESGRRRAVFWQGRGHWCSYFVGAVLGIVLGSGMLSGDLALAAELPLAATPEAQGVRSEGLRQLSQYVRHEGYDVRAMILLRHGRVVFEWYSSGVTREHNHNIYSITKSVAATLAGIAVDRGQVPGADAPIRTLLPESEAFRDDARKSRITLADLLTMRSGLPVTRGNRPSGPERELFDRIHQAPDRLASILDLPMELEPGKTFRYNNIDPQLVLSIVEHVTGERALPLAEEGLFRPLGFRNYRWVYPDRRGTPPGGYGLRLRAIDMAKLGQLYLDGGTWGGKRVLSKQWIDAATRDQTGTGYGYFWWTRIPVGNHESCAAKGVRGQRIQVVPDLDLVFVATANLAVDEIRKFYSSAMDQFVLDAVRSDGPLPESPGQLAALREELATARQYVPASRAGLDRSRLPWAPKQPAGSSAKKLP